MYVEHTQPLVKSGGGKRRDFWGPQLHFMCITCTLCRPAGTGKARTKQKGAQTTFSSGQHTSSRTTNAQKIGTRTRDLMKAKPKMNWKHWNFLFRGQRVVCTGELHPNASNPKKCMIIDEGDSGGPLACKSTRKNRYANTTRPRTMNDHAKNG